MAEADQPRAADQQRQRDGRHRQDHRARQQGQHIALAEADEGRRGQQRRSTSSGSQAPRAHARSARPHREQARAAGRPGSPPWRCRPAWRRSPRPPAAPARRPGTAAAGRAAATARASRSAPTSSAAMKAPRIEPMPPMTMTTKARISTLSPMPGSTERIGAAMHAGEARQHGAEAEDQHEEPADIDAERGDHRRIGRARAHQHADPRALDQQPEQPGGREARRRGSPAR